MTPTDDIGNGPFGPISRRSAIGSALLAVRRFSRPALPLRMRARRGLPFSRRASATT